MADMRSASPASEAYSDGMDSLSMRDKSLLKRSASKHHNNNFKAGYVPVHEQYLQKTGIRGRKTFAFWALVGLLFILAVGNLILTMTILGVLRLGQGMQSLELVPEENSLKFFGYTDLDYVYKRDGLIEGYENIPLHILSERGSINFNLVSRTGRSAEKFQMSKNGTHFKNIDTFEVKNKNGKAVFTTNLPNYRIVKTVSNINAKMAQTNRIVSPTGDSLELDAKTITLKGAEGTEMEAREIVWSADQDVYLQSINGSIVLSGKEGIYVDIHKIPIVVPKHNSFMTSQFKVCVCMPQGKLFRIPVPANPNTKIYCTHVDPSDNPCST